MPRIEEGYHIPHLRGRRGRGFIQFNKTFVPQYGVATFRGSREGPDVTQVRQAERASKPEPLAQTHKHIAPVPNLEFVCINGLPFFYPPLFWRSKHERVH